VGDETIYVYEDLEHCAWVFVGSPEANTRYQRALEAPAIARAMIWDDL
jgi:hypothetical protein